jgi:hypothetical protein
MIVTHDSEICSSFYLFHFMADFIPRPNVLIIVWFFSMLSIKFKTVIFLSDNRFCIVL